jgi:hypothetical protein
VSRSKSVFHELTFVVFSLLLKNSLMVVNREKKGKCLVSVCPDAVPPSDEVLKLRRKALAAFYWNVKKISSSAAFSAPPKQLFHQLKARREQQTFKCTPD